MKKLLFLLLTLMTMAFVSNPLSAQSTLTVANGTDTCEFVPVYGYYTDAYVRSQTIYPASMLTSMSGSAITAMSFYFQSTPEYDWNTVFAVKLLEVSDTAFNSTEYFSTATAQTVYTGTLINVGGIMGITFDLPYNYFGGNLLVEIVSVNPGEYYAKSSFLGITSPNKSIQAYSYVGVPTGGSSLEIRNFIPKTTFSYSVANYCETPTSLYTTDLGQSSITLHWNGNNHAIGYNLQYMYAYQTDWDNNAIDMTIADTSILLINLQPSASYQFRVRTICNSNDTSYWSSIQEFSMLNIPVTAPHFQDFETNSSTISDFYFTHSGGNCWNIGQATFAPDSTFAIGHSLYISENYGLSNTYNYTSSSFAYATMDVLFDNSLTEWHLSFDYKVTGESPYWDFFAVYLMDDTTAIPDEGAPSGIALLNQATNVTSWTHYDIVLDSVAGTTKRIIFFWKNDGSLGNNPPAAVDNISISGVIPTPPCTAPTQLTATEISNDHVTLSWSGNADQYAVYMTGHAYGYYTTPDTTIVISGLTGDTEYSFQVRSLCASDSSELTPALTITTQSDPIEPCDVPTGLDTTVVLNEAIGITWDNAADVFGWNVRYRQQNDEWTTFASDVNVYLFTELTGQTTYEFQVQANCGDDNLSDWCEPLFVTTKNVGIENFLLNSISLYPNPAKEVVNVQCTMNNVQIESIDVFDVYGKVIRTVVGADNHSSLQNAQINVSGLAAGMYFVRMTTEQGVVTKSFVKK